MNKQSLASQSPGKILIVCGPTSTGKTPLAIKLARKFNGEIVSADSRQVYKGLNIGTGKDLPKNAKYRKPIFGTYGYYEIEGVRIWGYDLIDPRREFSVAQFVTFAHKIIGDIDGRGKLPILVGGTGFYIKGVIDGISTAFIPRNGPLRKNLERRSAEELFESLSQMDSIKAASLNASDKKNPRRLIRAMEIATWKINNAKKFREEVKKSDYSILMIGLKSPEEFLYKRIQLRVGERIKNGLEEEIKHLLKNKVSWRTQSMSSLGYKQWKNYFEGKASKRVVVDSWEREERKYAKRQMTWFKKDKRIKWFDITQKNYPEGVEKLVEKWYHSGNNAEES